MSGENAEWGTWARYWAGEFMRWVFYRPSIGAFLLKLGTFIVLAALGGGWVIKLANRTAGSEQELTVEIGGGVADILTKSGFGLGSVMIILGIVLLLRDRRKDQLERERKRVLVIEQRGLLARDSAPLMDAVPKRLAGQRLAVIVDHTKHLQDGVLIDRGSAFAEVMHIRRDVDARLREISATDVTLVYGGVSPVPLTFLAGVLLDDEGCIQIMDWHRFRGCWLELDAADDGDRFPATDFSAVTGADEVSLAVTISYDVDVAAARALYPDVPMLEMRLPGATVNNHWAEAKQQALAEAFMQALMRLAGMGVRSVNLFLAAPNSVVFRFGRSYDRRTMPILTVHQFEKSDPRRFPWGVRMPFHGEPEPALSFVSEAA